MTNKFFYLIILFSCTLPLKVFAQVDPRWKKIFEDQNLEIFIDPKTVSPIRNPQITSKGFTFIDMVNFKNTAEDSEIFASVTHIATLDCINPGYKNEGGRLYKKYYAKGAGESFPASSWVNIPQHANEQAKIIYKYFCDN